MPEKDLKDEMRKKAYLVGKTLTEREFTPTYPDEYALCVFCWCRISGKPKDVNEGFYEEENADWICHDCVKKHSDAFCWSLVKRRKKTFIEILAEEEDFEIPMI